MSSGAKAAKRSRFALPSTKSEAESKEAEPKETDAAVEGLQQSFGKCMKDLEVGGWLNEWVPQAFLNLVLANTSNNGKKMLCMFKFIGIKSR